MWYSVFVKCLKWDKSWFQSDDEEEEGEAILDTGEGEDDPLSYIPDPDKVYGPAGGSEDSGEGETDSEQEDR